ncbi:hypothetical protein [Flagellimonas sp.]|uniref:hypothetical protein n=1 Tax=Flagellimonas sp. TaxID=2058762 RepID=UPI003BB0211C
MAQEFKKINISDLKLDADNPRLPRSTQQRTKKEKDKAEEIIIEFMLLEAATLELMMAIGENDYFAGEQLLVVEDKEEKGKYIVIEGNRRLTAVKLLSNPELAKVKKESLKKICAEADYKPTEIPCLIFEKKENILKYLGFRHITGIKSWRLLEKARYLNDLKAQEFKGVGFGQACRDIAKMIGSSSSYIRRLLTGLRLYKKVEDEGFYKIDGLNDTKFHLNYFVDALNKEHLRKFIGVDFNSDKPVEKLKPDNLKTITHWWFEKTEGQPRVLGDSKGLKKLDAVVSNDVALKAFKDQGATIDEAYDLTGEIDIRFRKEIEKSLASLTRADIYSTKVKDFYSEMYEDLRTIREITSKIRDYQRQRENRDDDF